MKFKLHWIEYSVHIEDKPSFIQNLRSLILSFVNHRTKINTFENLIRDSLADDLSVLERGLRLIRKEFFLENSFGANGSIDILAEDLYGNKVVIEIKRSDQAARQALHELFKYVSVIHRQLGISRERIRAILASTTWHELALPFSEYLQKPPCHTDGIEVQVDPSGKIIGSNRFIPIPLVANLEFSRVQSIYLYQNRNARDMDITKISSDLSKASLQDHVLLSLNFTGNDENVMFPYGTYLLFSSPFFTMTEQQQVASKTDIKWDDELDDPDENFLVHFSNNQYSNDTFEIGYPEKLHLITQTWKTQISVRAGRYKDNENVLSNDALLAQAIQIEGGATDYLRCVISPRFADRWTTTINATLEVAYGNQVWLTMLPLIFQSIKENNNDNSVAINIYHIGDTYYSLAKLSSGDFSYIPSFEIICQEDEGIRVFTSCYAWNGVNIEQTMAGFFSPVENDIFSWLMARHFNAQRDFDDSVRSLANLDTPVYEVWIPSNGDAKFSELSILHESIQRTSVLNLPSPRIKDYLESNREFFMQYRNAIAENSVGLVENR